MYAFIIYKACMRFVLFVSLYFLGPLNLIYMGVGVQNKLYLVHTRIVQD